MLLRDNLVKCYLSTTPAALAKCLSAVDWERQEAAYEVGDVIGEVEGSER